jgi:hypothetical protein
MANQFLGLDPGEYRDGVSLRTFGGRDTFSGQKKTKGFFFKTIYPFSPLGLVFKE